MGQVSSQSDNKNKQEIKQDNNDTQMVKDTYSSYKGLKTENSENPPIKESSIETNSNYNKEKEDLKVQTHFEWKEGGNVVYVTGSFSNWSQWFVMNKTQNNIFDLTLVKIKFY
jgi:hypothetical protein